MANPEQLERLHQGRNAWNAWRRDLPKDQAPDLGQADLRGLDLSGYNFRGAHLCDAMFDGANLSSCNFINAALNGASFSQANLTNAYLSGALLTDARFTGAVLSGTILDSPSNSTHSANG